ncbi:hypothetical protein HI914_05028 [Erysiphe necator]|nr:hypothetical protein HI914_05028 [Erysiphe necator]
MSFLSLQPSGDDAFFFGTLSTVLYGFWEHSSQITDNKSLKEIISRFTDVVFQYVYIINNFLG